MAGGKTPGWASFRSRPGCSHGGGGGLVVNGRRKGTGVVGGPTQKRQPRRINASFFCICGDFADISDRLKIFTLIAWLMPTRICNWIFWSDWPCFLSPRSFWIFTDCSWSTRMHRFDIRYWKIYQPPTRSNIVPSTNICAICSRMRMPVFGRRR